MNNELVSIKGFRGRIWCKFTIKEKKPFRERALRGPKDPIPRAQNLLNLTENYFKAGRSF